jgi:histidine ammonia-lyase
MSIDARKKDIHISNWMLGMVDESSVDAKKLPINASEVLYNIRHDGVNLCKRTGHTAINSTAFKSVPHSLYYWKAEIT